ncbi:DUF349 domain-containing protein [Tahibacter amnicola]|uniref:DUF349 domain-containing protein n=1 Tax=Tahibacter amnicola TaxID=2976241 RepID=A0ABY6BAI4_9GAMM|nr:DUF349 domain-containing protein [Tahibacter amnicola]UXI66684.1 DUF349 domain-containing protein [Tahibacter amnicola]
MKLARFLFKPRWQSKDPATRRGAVTELNDPELIAALPTIARTDADAGVRLAALRRVNQYEAWRERSTADSDNGIRETARTAYLAMLIGRSDGVPPLERRVAELDTLSPDEIERVATEAVDRDLRSAALERATRPSLLAAVAINDNDPKLRLVALSRINDLDALARIAERTRKTDKVVSRLARERVEAGRIAAGDLTTIELRARQLCERIEALLAVPRSERSGELASLDEIWATVAETAPAQLRERFQSTRSFLRSDTAEAAEQRERLRDLRTRLDIELARKERPEAPHLESLLAEANSTVAATSADLPERERVETLIAELTRRLAALAVELPPATAPVAAADPGTAAENDIAAVEHADLEALAAQARFDAALARAQLDKEKQREQHQALRRDLDALVIELETLLEAGDISAAHAVHARIATMLEGLPPLARHDKRLANAQARYAELKRWQRWSNNERRKQLCEQVEALAAQGLHPDAVATRVREARQEWQQIDALETVGEGADAARAANPFGKRFHALCNQALKPTQEYFEKRDALRKTHQQDVEAQLQALEAVPEDADWATLGRHRKDAGEVLRSLDKVDPRARKELARRLKDLIARLDARLDAHAAEVEAAKRKLIAEAERVAGAADLAGAAREVKELQARWKTIGNGKRRTDEAQWKAFRAACDAVFGKLDAGRRERAQQESQARQAAQDLVERLEALAEAPVDIQRAQRRELEQSWADVSVRDRELDRRWNAALDTIEQRRRDEDRVRRLALFTRALDRLALCEQAERGALTADQALEQWGSDDGLPERLVKALEQRRSAAAVAVERSADAETTEHAHDVTVELEFLGAVETPEHDRKRRMDLQVSRLSKRMSGGDQTSPRDELLALIARWVEIGALPEAQHRDLQPRVRKAIEAAVARLP